MAAILQTMISRTFFWSKMIVYTLFSGVSPMINHHWLDVHHKSKESQTICQIMCNRRVLWDALWSVARLFVKLPQCRWQKWKLQNITRTVQLKKTQKNGTLSFLSWFLTIWSMKFDTKKYKREHWAQKEICYLRWVNVQHPDLPRCLYSSHSMAVVTSPIVLVLVLDGGSLQEWQRPLERCPRGSQGGT